MRTLSRSLVLVLVVAACRSGSSGREAATHDPVLPFMSDDAAGALAVAKERKLPLFVDTWAPW